MVKYVRPIQAAVVRDPDAPGVMQILDPSLRYRSDNPLAIRYVHLFASDEDGDEKRIESARRQPGESR